MEETFGHAPVLLGAVREFLAPQPKAVVVDATIGVGGHAGFFAETLGPEGRLVGVDIDPSNLVRARERLAGAVCRLQLIRGNFAQLPELLESISESSVDLLFADLGVSSTQLDRPERGFSFQREGPLDMRLDPEGPVTAADLVNRLKERELADLIYQNSQEPAARRIARHICEFRREGRITTTTRLAQLVAEAVGVDPLSRRAKIHPATRTFLALRIAVNDEIGSLQALLKAAPALLRPGGRLGIITFHSLEDKPVKLDFRKRKTEGVYRVVTEKPVTAGAEERMHNPRSRSAKLRVAERLPPI